MELTVLQAKTLRAITYFDVINYPPTLLEIYRALEVKADLKEVVEALMALEITKLISQDQGFYFLTERGGMPDKRLTRYRIATDKLRKVGRHIRWIKLMPWVRGAALFSSLALKNSEKSGDFDLLIITSKNRLWSSRLFLISILKLLRLRPQSHNHHDKLCLSYLIDESSQDLSPIHDQQNDFYYYYYGVSFAFVLSDRLRSNFFAVNNWINQVLPNWQPMEYSQIQENNNLQRIVEFLFAWLPEKTLRKWQLNIMPDKYKKMAEQNDNKVILKDNIIKIHDHERKRELSNQFEQKYQELISYAKNF